MGNRGHGKRSYKRKRAERADSAFCGGGSPQHDGEEPPTNGVRHKPVPKSVPKSVAKAKKSAKAAVQSKKQQEAQNPPKAKNQRGGQDKGRDVVTGPITATGPAANGMHGGARRLAC